MAKITIRDIPERSMQRVRVLSEAERRSVDKQLIVLLEEALAHRELSQTASRITSISKEAQLQIWESLAGRWKDKRSTAEIIEDIYAHRTAGD